MSHKTAPQYPGSHKDLEKKKTFLFFATLILFGVVYAIGSPLLDRSKLLGAVIMVPAWVVIFVANNSINKWLTNEYAEKRRVWCDFWESYDKELKQLRRKYDQLPDGDEKLDLQYEILKMEKYWHRFDNYE